MYIHVHTCTYIYIYIAQVTSINTRRKIRHSKGRGSRELLTSRDRVVKENHQSGAITGATKGKVESSRSLTCVTRGPARTHTCAPRRNQVPGCPP